MSRRSRPRTAASPGPGRRAEPRRRTGQAAQPGRPSAKPGPPCSTAPARPMAWWQWFALAAVLALLGILCVRKLESPDLGFHLRAGEALLDGQGFPRTDRFTYTLTDHEYLQTSWGYEVLTALVYRLGRAPGLVVFHAVLVLATFVLLFRSAALAGAPPAANVVLLLLAGLACEMRFETRPEIASYCLLALTLHLLHRRAAGRRGPLWMLPVILLVWANVHSLFVLGWAAIGVFLAGASLRARRLDRALAPWALAALVAPLANPYGLRGMLFPFELLTRFQAENVFAQSIGELVSPFDLALSAQFPFYPRVPIFAFRAFALLSLFGALVAARRRRWSWLFLWLAFAPLGLQAVRNMPLLVVASFPATAVGLTALRIPGRFTRAGPALARAAVAAVVAAALGAGLLVVHDAYYIASRRDTRFGWGWNEQALPVKAAAFAERTALAGPVLNHLNFGGHWMWARREPVFIDGRLEVVGEEFYRAYVRLLDDAEALEAAVAARGIRVPRLPLRRGAAAARAPVARSALAPRLRRRVGGPVRALRREWRGRGGVRRSAAGRSAGRTTRPDRTRRTARLRLRAAPGPRRLVASGHARARDLPERASRARHLPALPRRTRSGRRPLRGRHPRLRRRLLRALPQPRGGLLPARPLGRGPALLRDRPRRAAGRPPIARAAARDRGQDGRGAGLIAGGAGLDAARACH